MASTPAWATPRTYKVGKKTRRNTAAAAAFVGITVAAFVKRQQRGWLARGGESLTSLPLPFTDKWGREQEEETTSEEDLVAVRDWRPPDARNAYEVDGVERVNRDGVCQALGIRNEHTLLAMEREGLLPSRAVTTNPTTGYREVSYTLAEVFAVKNPDRRTVGGIVYVSRASVLRRLKCSREVLRELVNRGDLSFIKIGGVRWYRGSGEYSVQSVEEARRAAAAAKSAPKPVRKKTAATFDGRYPDGRVNLAVAVNGNGKKGGKKGTWTVSRLKKYIARGWLPAVKQQPPRVRGRANAEWTVFPHDVVDLKKRIKASLESERRPGHMTADETAADRGVQNLGDRIALGSRLKGGRESGQIAAYRPELPVMRTDGKPGRPWFFEKVSAYRYLDNPPPASPGADTTANGRQPDRPQRVSARAVKYPGHVRKNQSRGPAPDEAAESVMEFVYDEYIVKGREQGAVLEDAQEVFGSQHVKTTAAIRALPHRWAKRWVPTLPLERGPRNPFYSLAVAGVPVPGATG